MGWMSEVRKEEESFKKREMKTRSLKSYESGEAMCAQ